MRIGPVLLGCLMGIVGLLVLRSIRQKPSSNAG